MTKNKSRIKRKDLTEEKNQRIQPKEKNMVNLKETEDHVSTATDTKKK